MLSVIETSKCHIDSFPIVAGIITISMEVELAWGVHDLSQYKHLSENGQAERIYLNQFLNECTQLQLPISFDIVGHLFLSECTGDHASPHHGDWFKADPGTDYCSDPLYYAPDMVDAIRTAPINHEICTHTFSHALFNEISRETAKWEIQQAQNMHREKLGEPTVSLVPPRHQSPPYDMLSEMGIEILRPAKETHSNTKLHRFKQLLAGPTPSSMLRIEEDIVETYCTTHPSLTAASLPSGQGKSHVVFRYLPVSFRKNLHLYNLKRATKTAARENGHLHLWCHLYDLSNNLQWRTVRSYLRWLDSYRKNKDFQVATMKELNEHVRNNV